MKHSTNLQCITLNCTIQTYHKSYYIKAQKSFIHTPTTNMFYCLTQHISIYRQIREILSVGRSMKAASVPPVAALNWLHSFCSLCMSALSLYIYIISICAPYGSAECVF